MKTAADWNRWVLESSPKYPHEKVIQFVFRNFDRSRAKDFKFLDLGCGNGVNSIFLHAENYQSYGVDISEGGVQLIQQKTKNPKNYKVGSIENVDFPNEFFDGLICVGVLETVSHEIAAEGLREAFRVLKAGGKGMFLFAAVGDYREKNDWIAKVYDEQEVSKMFKNAGFLKIDIDEYLTTYNNKTYRQRDWLITVEK